MALAWVAKELWGALQLGMVEHSATKEMINVATYILLSRLTDTGAATIKEHPDRIKEVNQEIETYGARVLHQYATLGAYDFVSVVEAPDLASIVRMSVELGSRGSVRIQTLSALPVDDFIANLN